MQSHHVNARQFSSRSDRSGHRVGDVVKFQVEEDSEAHIRELFDGSRSLGGKELTTDFEKAGCPAQLARQGAGRPDAIDIQGND
jgi:hypothetical protein